MGDENFVMVHSGWFNETESQFVIFSPDYRLAPENPFPAAPEDCYSALIWVKQNAKKYFGNPDRIIIGGTSAGGNLAAVVSLMARDDKTFQPKPYLQILHVPSVNFYLNTQSAAEYTATPIWNTAMMLYARHLYLPNVEDWGDFRSSPLFAESHKNLPPAFIIVNKFDPFYSDGLAYYEKLKENGVMVEMFNIDAYHAGDVMLYKLFGCYEEEILEGRRKLKNFLQKLPKKLE